MDSAQLPSPQTAYCPSLGNFADYPREEAPNRESGPIVCIPSQLCNTLKISQPLPMPALSPVPQPPQNDGYPTYPASALLTVAICSRR